MLESKYGDRKYVIEEDLPEIGFYLYVYEGEDCIMDYLQDSIELCKEFAEEEFGVPTCSWIELRAEV